MAEDSLTIHSASCRKLTLLNTSSDNSGIASNMQTLRKDTDPDSEDETDSCDERVTERKNLNSQELEDSLQCVHTALMEIKLEQCQVSKRQRQLRSAYFGDAQMRIRMEKEILS